MFAGRNENSAGIAFAKSLNTPTSTKSIEGVLLSKADIVFDATTAQAHKLHAPRLRDRFVIDLTPAKLFPLCVPGISKIPTKGGVSLGSCTIQAVIPKLAKIKNLEYVEVVTTVASESVGMGTRENLSEYLETTQKAIHDFTGAKAKSILIINPSLQSMYNTIYAIKRGSKDPWIVHAELLGCGDYIDPRFGNLDVMTIAAINVAEDYAKHQNI